MDYIHLTGAEDVENAASSIHDSAGMMQQAAINIEDSLLRHRQFLDDWLYRLENIIVRIDNKSIWNYSTGRTLECQSILDSAKEVSQQFRSQIPDLNR